MGKRIAVITGASSGIGRCFALTAEKHGKFDELWAIAQKRMECWDCDAEDCEGCDKLED